MTGTTTSEDAYVEEKGSPLQDKVAEKYHTAQVLLVSQ